MNQDERLKIDPISRRLRREETIQENAIADSLGDAEWARILDPIVSGILDYSIGSVPEEVPFPENGDLRFENAFRDVQKRFGSERAHQGTELVDRLFDHKLAERVALQLPGDVEAWFNIATLFRHRKNWASFPRQIPLSELRRRQPELICASWPIEKCFHTPGLRPAEIVGSLRILDQQRLEGDDEWQEINRLRRYSDQCILEERLQLQSLWLSRLSAKDWLLWAGQLPHPVVLAAAISEISDLDFIESIIRDAASTIDTTGCRLLLILAVLRALELWREISWQLQKAISNDQWGEMDDHEKFVQSENDWSSNELPKRAASVAARLCSSESALEVGKLFFNRLGVFAGPGRIEVRASSLFRDALVEEFAKHPIDCHASGCSLAPCKSSLNAAGLLAIRLNAAPDFEVAFAAYEEWLKTSKSIWHGAFSAEDQSLVEVLATILARIPNASDRADALIAALREPSQGWCFNYSRWLSSLPAHTHALTVTAFAGDRSAQIDGPSEETDQLLRLAMHELTILITAAPRSLLPQQVQTPIAYLWACMGRSSRESISTIVENLAKIDDIGLMILAASSFTTNGGKLSPDGKRLLRETFETQRSMLELNPHVSPERISELSSAVEQICDTSVE